MPKRNRGRPPTNKPTVEQCLKIKIQDLVTGRQYLPDGWSINTNRLRVHHLEWLIDNVPANCKTGLYFVRGDDGRRYRDILITPDRTHIGTRDQIVHELDIKSPYRSQREMPNKRHTRYRKDILKRLNVYDVDPTRDNEFNPPHKGLRRHWSTYWQKRMLAGLEDIVVPQPNRMRSETWRKLLNKLRKWSGQKPIKYLPGRGRRRSIRA